MMFIYMLGGLICAASLLVAGEPVRSARSAALGGVAVVLPVSAWSTYWNPAQLSSSHPMIIGALFLPHQYGLSEFRLGAFGVVVPTEFGGLGFSLERFGFDLYRETIVQVGFGASLAEEVSGGVVIEAKQIAIHRYGQKILPLLHAGTSVRVSDDLLLGSALRNVLGTSVGRIKERLPQSIVLGLRWSTGEAFLFACELEKEIRYSPILRLGLERVFLGTVGLRAGISTPPRVLSGGIALRLRGSEFGYAARFFGDLGWIHEAEISMELVR